MICQKRGKKCRVTLAYLYTTRHSYIYARVVRRCIYTRTRKYNNDIISQGRKSRELTYGGFITPFVREGVVVMLIRHGPIQTSKLQLARFIRIYSALAYCCVDRRRRRRCT